ncbi:MAG TPA: hypothetical protein VMF08_15490 [Candidatus Sulfotelmatobacter sp.]|nr:hypothetical protein [Candidatus Sulfotelmatobacter sp.]
MKTNFKSVLSLAAIAFAVSLTNVGTAAVIVTPPRVVAPPMVPMAPAPGFPATYVWDGNEFVGMIGNQYYYLGPGNNWVIMDPVRMNRFRGWTRAHPGWRDRQIRNTRFRNRGPNRPQPVRMQPVRPNQLPPPPMMR